MPEVPIRCTANIMLTCDVDITEKAALKSKITDIVQQLKTEFPDKIVENRVQISTRFADESWAV